MDKRGIVMAVEKISLALGPEDVLRAKQEKYPDRDLKLLESVVDEDKFMLLDKSNQKTVFGSGLNYVTQHEIGQPSWDGYYEFRYFTLDTKQRKILESIMQRWENDYDIPVGLKYSLVLHVPHKNLQYLMLNVWQSDIDFFDWNTSSGNKINQFNYNENSQPYISHFVLAPEKKEE